MKKIGIMLLIVIMSFSLVACGGSGADSTSNDSSSEAPATEGASDSEATSEGDDAADSEAKAGEILPVDIIGTGNVSNWGLATYHDGLIYYKNHAQLGWLYSMKPDGSERTQVGDGISVSNLVAAGDKLYYSDDGNNGRLCMMNLDGSDSQDLNEVNSEYFLVDDDWLYYIATGEDGKMYAVKLDGSETRLVTDDEKVRSMYIEDGVIYYTVYEGNGEYRYSINLDGTDKQKLSEEKVEKLTFADGKMYYSSSGVAVMDIDGSNQKQIIETESWVSCINVAGDWIFYTDHDDGDSIHVVKTDGSEHAKLNDVKSAGINIAGGWVLYNNYDDDSENALYMMRPDGSENQAV